MGRYSDILNDLIERIEYHAADEVGRILRGWKWSLSNKGGLDVPTSDTVGVKDLPGFRIYIPEISEQFAPARHINGALTINMLVATKRELGLVASLASLESVMDALQLTADGALAKKALTGTTRHFDWKAQDSFILENSINWQVSISTHPKIGEVGTRR